jgi:hypothetical protein
MTCNLPRFHIMSRPFLLSREGCSACGESSCPFRISQCVSWRFSARGRRPSVNQLVRENINPSPYSCRSASIGSIAAARLAGIQLAAKATPSSISADASSVTVSYGFSP